MQNLRHFQITYRLGGMQKLFDQTDSHMSDADAWYYSCLHAGVNLLYGADPAQMDHETLRSHAEKSGLDDVKWEELP